MSAMSTLPPGRQMGSFPTPRGEKIPWEPTPQIFSPSPPYACLERPLGGLLGHGKILENQLAEMSRRISKTPRCIVIAGPNGAGKTTFAREFLPKDARVVHFVNADLIAGGLSPLRPELAALTAGRLVLGELDRLAKSKQDFAFETTLSGHVFLKRSKRWKAPGHRID